MREPAPPVVQNSAWVKNPIDAFVLARLDAAHEAELVAAVRWVLRLDESFTDFHALCEQHPGLRSAGRCRLGRLLRSPTVWEDTAKTLLTTCTTWSRTCSMVAVVFGWQGVHLHSTAQICS